MDDLNLRQLLTGSLCFLGSVSPFEKFFQGPFHLAGFSRKRKRRVAKPAGNAPPPFFPPGQRPSFKELASWRASWRASVMIPQGQGAVCFSGRWAPGSILLYPGQISVNNKRVTQIWFTLPCRAEGSSKSRELCLYPLPRT